MAVPVYVPGQVLGAADCNNWFLPVVAYKTGDTSRTNNTLSADPDLTVPVAASSVYAVSLFLAYSGLAHGTSDLTVQFTAPASATLVAYSVFNTVTGTVGLSGNFALSAVTVGTEVSPVPLFLEGTLTTSTTPGNLVLTWAQHVTNATATVLKAGSRLILQKTG